jgi:hypothetical protein
LIVRQLSQLFVAEPIPAGMIWHYPGSPSLIVTYYTTFDFFFSGHTASATLSALEIGYRNYKNKSYPVLAIMLVMMEIFCILLMRFHYTADLITGIFASVTAFVLSQKVAPALDRALERMVERLSSDRTPSAQGTSAQAS